MGVAPGLRSSKFARERSPADYKVIMGNAQVRASMKPENLDYIAKNTRLMSREVVTEYFNKYVGVVSSGRIEADGFKEIFNLAFPSRPLDKLDLLTKELVDEDDTIAIGQLLFLLYMFSGAKCTDTLSQMFKLFDADNSKFICLNELRELMAYFIEVGEGKNHTNDPAKIMAEMFHRGDADGNEQLDHDEFIKGMLEHPVTRKILEIKTIDGLIELL